MTSADLVTRTEPSWVRSGWLPAGAVFILTALLLRTQAHVELRDTVAFSCYVALCLSLPGTLVWRWLDRREARPLIEDLVLGTIMGYVVELPAYLLCLALGAPRLGLFAPITIVALTLATPRGRTLWRRPTTRMPMGWSWSMAAVVAYCVAWVAHNIWSTAPMTREGLRSPYVDEPFHLALVGELRHHLPGDMPFVDGVPLFYHWLTYAHVASSSWVTGLEPVLLLRVLAMTPLIALTVAGIAVLASRLTSKPWYGVLAAALLGLVSTLDVFGWTPAAEPWAGGGFTSAYLYASPTQTFATMLYLPLLLLIAEVLTSGVATKRIWAVLPLLMLVVAGSKATYLPITVAGLACAAVLGVSVMRRLSKSTTALTIMGVVVFVTAQALFYGGSSRSLSWSPFALIRSAAEQSGLGAESGLPALTVGIITVSYVVAQLGVAAGAIGLLRQRGWQVPLTQFLVGSALASFGAALMFGHPALSQFYFLSAGLPILVLASTLGLARLAAGSPNRQTAVVIPAGALAGLAIAVAISRLTRKEPPTPNEGGLNQTLTTVVTPQLLAVVAIALAATASVWFTRRRNWPGSAAVLGVVSVISGLGLIRTTAEIVAFADTPWSEASRATSVRPDIGPGGIDAARWLRDHSSPDELVATNAHCRGRVAPRCDARHFWISAYSERHVLVEGWAYIAPSTVGQPSNALTNSSHAPFWDAGLLARNDAAFGAPTAAALGVLQKEYGVRWLFVDLDKPVRLDGHHPVRLARLSELADVVYRQGDYAVLHLG